MEKFLKNKIFISGGIYNNKTIFPNTKESFQKTINANYGIYFGVLLSKDNNIIVYEESALERNLKIKNPQKSLTYDEINYLSLHQIMTLDKALSIISGKVPIIIKIGTNENKKIINLILAKLKNYPGDVGFVSNSSKIIYGINKTNKNLPVGEILTKDKPKELFHFMIKTTFKSVNIKYFDSKDIFNIRKSGQIIMGYQEDENLANKEFFDSLIIKGGTDE